MTETGARGAVEGLFARLRRHSCLRRYRRIQVRLAVESMQGRCSAWESVTDEYERLFYRMCGQPLSDRLREAEN